MTGRKLLCVVLAALLLCLPLTSCGKIDHNEDEASNLGHWARALAAPSMQEQDGNPLRFGGDLSEETAAQLLTEQGIETRDELLERLRFLFDHGSREDYHFDADALTLYGEEELEAALAELDELVQAHYRRVLRVWTVWGEDGLTAVDASEAAFLAQLGYSAGLLTHEEAQALVEPAAALAKGAFENWEQFLQALADGCCVSDGLEPESETYSSLVEGLSALRESTQTKRDVLFDDGLFTEELRPIEGASAKALLK